MDSITQAVLGAAVGEATAGKKAGNKAIIAGAIAGTVPDLDVVFRFFTDTVTNLHIHRGLSHSLFFAVIFAPVLGFLFSKLFKKAGVRTKTWTLLSFLGMSTHSLLDVFTSYGTGLFEPFSEWRIAISSIGIIDPVYTLLLIAGVTAALFIKERPRRRRAINWIGIGLSTIYLSFTLINKAYINTKLGQTLISKNVHYSDFKTFPRIPFNSHWHAIITTNEGFLYTEINTFSTDSLILEPIAKNDSLGQKFKDQEKIEQLKQFSKGLYSFDQQNGQTVFYDLRFGRYQTGNNYIYPFTFILNQKGHSLFATHQRP